MILKKFFWTALLVSTAVHAQETLRRSHYNLKGGVAVQGYDVVAYFKSHKALEGTKSLNTSFEGIQYWFSSKENLEAFKKSPRQFEPQYGGWCAYAMGTSGEKVEVDPETFKILGGKLYLFYNQYFTNTLNDWNKNEATLMAQAERNWMLIFK